MEFRTILYEEDKHIALITINRPPANKFNLSAIMNMEAAIDEAERDKDIRVVIITGYGRKRFSEGFDGSDSLNAAMIAQRGRALWTRIDRLSKPVIAAINGYAFGAGCELAMACTFRVMRSNTKIGLTELDLGIIPGWGGTQRMPRIVGKSKALDMILFSRRIAAWDALKIGLVDRVSTEEKLMKDVIEMALLLSKRPPLAVKAVLKAVSAGLYDGIEEGNRLEELGSEEVAKSLDAMEGFTAHMQMREPNFKGL